MHWKMVAATGLLKSSPMLFRTPQNACTKACNLGGSVFLRRKLIVHMNRVVHAFTYD